MTIQDQYIDTVRQSQEKWAGMVQAATQNIQAPIGQVMKGFPSTDPSRIIEQSLDQVFDYWATAVQIQRDATKQVIAGNLKIADQVAAQAQVAQRAVQGHAENIGGFAREQAETVKGAAEEQAEAVKGAVQEQAAARYEPMNKADLQTELGRRDLPTTGNVDELRARLVEDDLKVA